MSFAPRRRYEWRLARRSISLGSRTFIMGILNLTPDSFSDGGRFNATNTALEHALDMLESGADILDLGGESTRPNAIPITPAEEQSRVLPVLRSILKERPNAILSIDTYHAETARAAVDAGAEIVNDVSGHLWDEEMSATCAGLRCGCILMHTRGRPQEWRTQPRLQPEQVVPLVVRELKTRMQAALSAGIMRESVVLDPGFGFGKVLGENYPLLAGLDELKQLELPLVVGVSRKSFLGRALTQGVPGHSVPTDTALPTSAANVAAILSGAHILRVHDVVPAIEAAAVADHILTATTMNFPEFPSQR